LGFFAIRAPLPRAAERRRASGEQPAPQNPRVRKEIRGKRIDDSSITRGRARLRPGRAKLRLSRNIWVRTEPHPPDTEPHPLIVGVTCGSGAPEGACANRDSRGKVWAWSDAGGKRHFLKITHTSSQPLTTREIAKKTHFFVFSALCGSLFIVFELPFSSTTDFTERHGWNSPNISQSGLGGRKLRSVNAGLLASRRGSALVEHPYTASAQRGKPEDSPRDPRLMEVVALASFGHCRPPRAVPPSAELGRLVFSPSSRRLRTGKESCKPPASLQPKTKNNERRIRPCEKVSLRCGREIFSR